MTSNASVGASHVVARLVAVASFLCAGVASAQSPATQARTAGDVDPRFQPWMGCWSPITPSARTDAGQQPPSMACVVPSTSVSGSVDIVVFDSANVQTRSAVPLPGTRIAKTIDGCAGTETATWMPDDRRLLMQAELSCGRGAKRLESGLMTMTSGGQWLQVQHLDVGGNAVTAVMTMRYVADSLGEWARLGAGATTSTLSLRLAVGAPLLNSEVLEVAKRAPAALSEAWLAETGQRFAVSGKELVRLADGGMPARVLDLMIAISNPETFAVRAPGGERNRLPAGDATTSLLASSRGRGNCGRMDDFCYGPGGMGAWGLGWQYGMSGFDPYGLRYGVGGGYGSYNPYGIGGVGGWGNPVVIVHRGAEAAPRGRAVRGGGYTRDASPASSPSSASYGGGSQSSSGGSAGGASSGSGGGSGSTGGAEGGRTAKPRGGGK